MYYTGLDPLTMKPVYVATDPKEKQLQRALLQFKRPENASLVREALKKCGREDLIGNAPGCLVRPEASKSTSGKKFPSHRSPSQRNRQNTRVNTQNKKSKSRR